jgi:hypothetical protein
MPLVSRRSDVGSRRSARLDGLAPPEPAWPASDQWRQLYATTSVVTILRVRFATARISDVKRSMPTSSVRPPTGQDASRWQSCRKLHEAPRNALTTTRLSEQSRVAPAALPGPSTLRGRKEFPDAPSPARHDIAIIEIIAVDGDPRATEQLVFNCR